MIWVSFLLFRCARYSVWVVKGRHNAGGMLQVVYRFKQGDDIHMDLIFFPSSKQKKGINFHNIPRTIALADDITVASCFAIFFLYDFNRADTGQGIFCQFISKRSFGNGFQMGEYFYFFIFIQRIIMLRKYFLSVVYDVSILFHVRNSPVADRGWQNANRICASC